MKLPFENGHDQQTRRARGGDFPRDRIDPRRDLVGVVECADVGGVSH